MQVIFQSNPQQVFMTDIHDNQVANVTIGTNEAKQRPTVPMEEPELTPCEIVPEAQEQPTNEETPAEQPTPEPIRLTAKELNAMHLLYGAGLLNKEYKFYTKKETAQNKKLRFLTTGERALIAKTLGTLFGSAEYLQYYCKDYWQMPAKKQTISGALSDLYKDHPDQAQAFQQELDKILLPFNKKAW